MTDHRPLDDQLKAYIDSVEPVTTNEVLDQVQRPEAGQPRPYWQGPALAGAVAVLALAVLGLTQLLGGDTRTADTLPASTIPATTLPSTTIAPTVVPPTTQPEPLPTTAAPTTTVFAGPAPCGQQAGDEGGLRYEGEPFTRSILFPCTNLPGRAFWPVQRPTDPEADVIDFTMRALLAGITDEEAERGFTTVFGDLEELYLGQGRQGDATLVLDFAGLSEFVCSPVCSGERAADYLSELFENVFSYDIDSVLFTDNGDCDAFWRPLQSGCQVASFDSYQALLDSLRSSVSPLDLACETAESCREALTAAYRQLLAGSVHIGVTFFDETTAAALEGIRTSDDGSVVVDFNDDILVDNANTSTGGVFFRAELENAAFQVGWVQSVTFTVDGSCEAFWGWQQIGGCQIVTREGWRSSKTDPQGYVGMVFTGSSSTVAPGLLDQGGGFITDVDEAPAFLFSVVTDLVHHMVWLERLDGEEKTILAVLDLALEPEDVIWHGPDVCQLNGEFSVAVIGIGPIAEPLEQGRVDVRLAYLADVESGSFLVLDPTQVSCSFEPF